MVRIKHRYLVVNILFPSLSLTAQPQTIAFHSPSPSHLTVPLLLSNLRATLSLLFGDYGLGVTSSSLKMIYFSPATSTFILRCPRAHFRLVWAALTCMERLPAARRGDVGVECAMRVVRVSGTIRKAEEEVLRRTRMEIVRVKTMVGGAVDGLLDGSLGGPKEARPDERGIEDLSGEEEEMEDVSD